MGKIERRKHHKLEKNKRLYAGLTPTEQLALYAKLSAKRKPRVQTSARPKSKPKRRALSKWEQWASDARRKCEGKPGRVKDYDLYLKTRHWKETRLRKLESAGRECGRCGACPDLQVHHLHYRTLFAEEDVDLEVVCKGCHVDLHSVRTDSPV